MQRTRGASKMKIEIRGENPVSRQQFILKAENILRYLITEDEELNRLIIFKPSHIELITDDLSLYEALGSLQESDAFPKNKLTKLLEIVHVSSFRERTKKEKPILTEERVEALRKIALQGKSSSQSK